MLTKGATKHEGFITLHQKDQHLYAEIKPQQLEQPILAPMVIARGSASAGQPLNFGDEWVIAFRRVGEHLQLLRKNIHFTAPAGTPLDKAVKQNYTDSILMSLPILSINPQGGTLVIDFADIFLTDFAQVGFGGLDRSRSRWFKIRTYPNNDEIQVEATFTGARFRRSFGGASPVVDRRLEVAEALEGPDRTHQHHHHAQGDADRAPHFSSRLRILPVAVIGSESTNSTMRGYL